MLQIILFDKCQLHRVNPQLTTSSLTQMIRMTGRRNLTFCTSRHGNDPPLSHVFLFSELSCLVPKKKVKMVAKLKCTSPNGSTYSL